MLRYFIPLLALTVALCATAQGASPLELMDAQYRADEAFPQFDALWGGGTSAADNALHNGAGVPRFALGGYLHVYVRNAGAQAVSISDVEMDGISLNEAIAFSDQRKFKKVTYAASIYFSKLPKEQIDRLIALGEPVWYRAQPSEIGPGQSAEVVIRLRKDPPASTLPLRLRLSDGSTLDFAVPTGNAPDRISDISFSEDLDTAYVFFRSQQPGRAPAHVLLDGVDVTASSVIGRDASLTAAPVVVRPGKAFSKGGYYSFKGVYEDGRSATAGVRAYPHELMYGVWGSKPGKEGDMAVGRAFLQDLADHNMNLHMVTIGSAAVQDFLKSDEGNAMLEKLGIRRVIESPGKQGTRFPYAYYLADEPDTGDYRVEGVPSGKQIGCLGQGLSQRSAELRKEDSGTPDMVNLNMTFVPHNWYTYGQLPDIFCADPYYQPRLRQTYEQSPGRYPLFAKAGYIYGEARISKAASQPRPLHIILYSNSYDGDGVVFRGPTPPEKRIEAYYAVAAGAKGLSYWWYIPGKPAVGVGADDPASKALWKELGLLGAEFRTAGSLITRSTPVDIPVDASQKLWVRALACGLDAMLVLVVNDDYLNDRQGTVIRPVEKASVTVPVPAWMKANVVFEISSDGLGDVQSEQGSDGLRIDLETVDVTRMLVITSDGALRGRLQGLYDRQFAENVKKLAVE